MPLVKNGHAQDTAKCIRIFPKLTIHDESRVHCIPLLKSLRWILKSK